MAKKFTCDSERDAFLVVIVGPLVPIISEMRSEQYRWKRSSRIMFGAASAMGAKATKKLVKGGELIPTEKTFRVYKKYGDLARALEDFESVKYTETLSFKTPNKGPGRAGTIGDRQVILHTTGDTGGPIIDVIKVIERSDSIGRKEIFGKITDRIIYENWSH